jgi:hypothetical protein
MNVPDSQSEQKELEEAQRVQHWARRYAQNRSLHVAAGLAVFALLWAAISVPSYWGGMAYRAGNLPLLVVCVVVMIVALAATIYVSVPHWGGRLMQRLAEGLYAREGQVTVSTSQHFRPWWGAVLGSVFGLCVAGTVVLGVSGYLPDRKYLQPISALYVVPFLLCLGFVLRPITGYIPLLWPLLYALHAVLIVAGAPAQRPCDRLTAA